jgi:type I restriction enzyme S subunit
VGLIAKITLPKQDPDSGEHEYLKAFRPLRSEEFTRMADVQALRRTLSAVIGEQRFYFSVQLDRTASESTGAGGMFQVISLEDDEGVNSTHLVDHGRHYASLDELKVDVASALKVDPKQVDLEEV